MLYDVEEVQRWLDARTVNGLDTPNKSQKTETEKNNPIKKTQPKKEKRAGPGRPPKTETVRAKNAGK